MHLWRGPAIIVVCALLLVSPFDAATRKKTATAASVSPAVRAASLQKVASHLEESAGAVLEQPGALVPVFERLYRLSSSQTRSPVHIIHFGDSHTAADDWTGGMREMWKARFGDGGSGFSLAGRPFLGYRRFDVHGGGTPGWHSEGLRAATGDGYFGLGGISISTAQAGQSVYIDTECDHLEVDYLQQPGGGDLALYDHDQRLEEFSTEGAIAPGYFRYQSYSGPHRFLLKTLNSRPVRLFGWVAERDEGVTYEALGINGAEAGVMMRWDESMLATYLQLRNPGLIVLAYGTNEASDPNLGPETYQATFSALLGRVRRAAPAASILVVGPADRWARYKNGLHPVPGIDWVIAAQRKACREQACAFWDTRERIGGKGAIRDWVLAGLAQGDYVHFTSAGYHKLASVLFDDVMQQYETYRKARLETADLASHGQAN